MKRAQRKQQGVTLPVAPLKQPAPRADVVAEPAAQPAADAFDVSLVEATLEERQQRGRRGYGAGAPHGARRAPSPAR